MKTRSTCSEPGLYTFRQRLLYRITLTAIAVGVVSLLGSLSLRAQAATPTFKTSQPYTLFLYQPDGPPSAVQDCTLSVQETGPYDEVCDANGDVLGYEDPTDQNVYDDNGNLIGYID